jgi:hypothetical protein
VPLITHRKLKLEKSNIYYFSCEYGIDPANDEWGETCWEFSESGSYSYTESTAESIIS